MYQLSKKQILDLTMNDSDSALELINVYLTSVHDILNTMDQQIQNDDRDSLRKSAHALKGAVSIWGVVELIQNIKDLEESYKLSHTKLSSDRFSSIKKELKNFSNHLENLKNEIQRSR